MKIVLDASAAIPAAMSVGAGPEIEARVAAAELVIAPELFVAEVANGFWKYVNAGDMTINEAVALFGDALALVSQVESAANLVPEALREAAARRHPVYDMFYLVLARREGATLLTLDTRMLTLAKAMNIETV